MKSRRTAATERDKLEEVHNGSWDPESDSELKKSLCAAVCRVQEVTFNKLLGISEDSCGSRDRGTDV